MNGIRIDEVLSKYASLRQIRFTNTWLSRTHKYADTESKFKLRGKTLVPPISLPSCLFSTLAKKFHSRGYLPDLKACRPEVRRNEQRTRKTVNLSATLPKIFGETNQRKLLTIRFLCFPSPTIDRGWSSV